MSKLRLDYFLSLGLKLVEGDTCTSPSLSVMHTIEDKDDAEDWNNDSDLNNQCFVLEFAHRKNTGEQPCGDDVPVIMKDKDNNTSRGAASYYEWSLKKGRYITFIPDLDALIKMQNEHDKQGKTVWDAACWSC